MIPNVLELILNNTIKVTPFDPTNHNNGYLKLTLADVGNVLAIPSETNYVSDPREIAFESTEDLPFKSVSIDSYALYPNRTIAVKSAETICLPDNIFGFVYAVQRQKAPLNITIQTLLPPGYDGEVSFTITNSWEYPIYLVSSDFWVQVVFYSTDHQYHTNMTKIDHPASAIGFSKPNGADVVFDNVKEIQSALDIIIGRLTTIESSLLDVKGDVAGLKTRMDKAENDILELKSGQTEPDDG